MIRRMLSVMLVSTLVAATMPKAAFAEEQQTPSTNAQPVQLASNLPDRHLTSDLPNTAHSLVLDLRAATQGVTLKQSTSALQATTPFLKSNAGKATLFAAILAASIVVCYKVAQADNSPTPAGSR